MNVNVVILAGRLTRDPELKRLPSGSSVCEVGLAVNRTWSPKDGGQKKEDTCFVDLVFWGATAETVAKHFKKGKEILVEGRLEFQQWEAQGAKRSKLRVVVQSFQFVGRDDVSGKKWEPAEQHQDGPAPVCGGTADADIPV